MPIRSGVEGVCQYRKLGARLLLISLLCVPGASGMDDLDRMPIDRCDALTLLGFSKTGIAALLIHRLLEEHPVARADLSLEKFPLRTVEGLYRDASRGERVAFGRHPDAPVAPGVK